MKRTLGLLAIGMLLGAGFYLRFYELDQKPMHTDEAVNGVMVHQMLAGESVAFDPSHYHGPLLRYLAIPVVKLADLLTGSGLTEKSLRLLTAIAGGAIVLMFLGYKGLVGQKAAYIAAGFASVSPPLIYYSRYFIHESIFVLCSLIFLKQLWRFWLVRNWKAAICVGVWMGVLHAIRETVVLVLFAAAVGLIVSMGREWQKHFKWLLSKDGLAKVGVIFLSGAVVSIVFYSAFFTYFQGVIDSVLTYFTYDKDLAHDKPWFYYMGLIIGEKSRVGYLGQVWILMLALAAFWRLLVDRITDPERLVFFRFIAGYTIASTIVYSLIAYKTPWLVLNFLVGWVLLAGIGWGFLWIRFSHVAVRVVLVVVVGFCFVNSLRQASLLNFRFSADPRNPFVYSHTSPDLAKLVDRIELLASFDSEGKSLRIDIAGTEYWPLPWYLRDFTRVGYWSELPADSEAKIRLFSFEGEEAVPELNPDKYTSELRGLRDGVFVLMFIENELWEKQFQDK